MVIASSSRLGDDGWLWCRNRRNNQTQCRCRSTYFNLVLETKEFSPKNTTTLINQKYPPIFIKKIFLCIFILRFSPVFAIGPFTISPNVRVHIATSNLIFISQSYCLLSLEYELCFGVIWDKCLPKIIRSKISTTCRFIRYINSFLCLMLLNPLAKSFSAEIKQAYSWLIANPARNAQRGCIKIQGNCPHQNNITQKAI